MRSRRCVLIGVHWLKEWADPHYQLVGWDFPVSCEEGRPVSSTYIEGIWSALDFIAAGNMISNTKENMWGHRLEGGGHFRSGAGNSVITYRLSLLQLRMLAGENRETGRGIGGNTANTLLDDKALGIGMAPETWECFKKSRDI
jgi:hypothetical protein